MNTCTVTLKSAPPPQMRAMLYTTKSTDKEIDQFLSSCAGPDDEKLTWERINGRLALEPRYTVGGFLPRDLKRTVDPDYWIVMENNDLMYVVPSGQFPHMFTVTTNPLETMKDLKEPVDSLQSCIARGSLDWSTTRQFAWMYGIIVGWDDEDNEEENENFGDDVFKELVAKFNWSDEDVARLRRLRAAFRAASEKGDQE